MARQKIAYEVLKLDVLGNIKQKSIVTQKTAKIFEALFNAGSRGITTKDFACWDVRHYVRNLRNNGIQISRSWEKNADGGQHGRWSLAPGYQFRKVPYPKKQKTRPVRRAS